MPEPASLKTRGVGEPDQTVLFLSIADTEEPTSVQLTFLSSFLPRPSLVREEILMTRLTLEIMPTRQ